MNEGPLGLINPPDPFSFEPERWKTWKSRFTRYINVSGQSGKSDKEKIDLLIYLMGEKAEDIYDQFSERPKTFDYALKTFDQYFNPKKPIGCLRASFYKREQEEAEPVEEFIKNLQNIANECDFGTMKDNMIRDKIIAGLRDVKLSSQLQLKENLTLEETIIMIQQAEEQIRQEVFPSQSDFINPVQELTPSTCYCQSSYQQTSQGCQEVSSSNSLQESLRLSQTMPDVLPIKPECITIEDDEEEVWGTFSLIYNSSYGNFIPENPTNIFSVKHEMNLGTEGSSDVVPLIASTANDDSDFESPSASESSVIIEEMNFRKNKKPKTSSLGNYNCSDNRPTSGKSINDLSDENLLNIFSYLNIRDRIRIERVCQRWKKVLDQKSWGRVKKLHILNDFKIERINRKSLKKILRRSGFYITHLDCSWLHILFHTAPGTHPPKFGSTRIIRKYCKKLTHLNICYIRDQWNNALKMHSGNLKALDVNFVKNLKSLRVGSEVFRYDHLPVLLKNAVNLEEFVIVGYDNEKNDFLNLSQKCTTLSILFSEKLTDDMLEEILDTHPNIENLDVSGTNITSNALFPFTKRLTSLTLWQMENFFKNNLESYKLLKFPHLRVLDLSFNSWFLTGGVLLVIIENCPEVEDLRLKGACDLNKDDFKHLEKLKKLMYLDVSYTKITNSQLLSLANGSSQLKSLLCYGCNSIGVPELNTTIAVSPELTYLAITSSKLTKDFIKSALSSLQERENKLLLTISLRSNCPDTIPDAVKKLELRNGIHRYSTTNILRIVYARRFGYSPKFEKTCTNFDDEETLEYFD